MDRLDKSLAKYRRKTHRMREEFYVTSMRMAENWMTDEHLRLSHLEKLALSEAHTHLAIALGHLRDTSTSELERA